MGVEGIGASVVRKEDKRFIAGKGRYVDDIKLPGMTTLCPGNPLGIKGCGEAGAIGGSAAVINAIADAIGKNKSGNARDTNPGLASDARRRVTKTTVVTANGDTLL